MMMVAKEDAAAQHNIEIISGALLVFEGRVLWIG
jgi:hypothetical protein